MEENGKGKECFEFLLHIEFLLYIFHEFINWNFIKFYKKVVLYNILEQKLLNNANTNNSDSIAKLKSTLFNEGLIKTKWFVHDKS